MDPATGEDTNWWFCLRHHEPEQGPGCPGKDRLGPYATREEAQDALETVRRRNEAWEAGDRWPSEPGRQD